MTHQLSALMHSTPLDTPEWKNCNPTTLTELVASFMDIDYDRFMREGLIEINGEVVPREWWDEYETSPGDFVQLHMIHAGGGGGDGGGKNVLATLATVLVSFAVFSVSGGALAPFLGSSFAKGTIGASLASVAIGVGGQLALNALFPPAIPDFGDQDDGTGQSGQNSASVGGNVLGIGETIPRVVGTYTMNPPLLVQPRAYLEGEDVIVEAIFGLAGPTSFDDIRVRGIPIQDIDGIEFWTDSALPETERVNQFDRYARTQNQGITLTKMQVSTDSGSLDGRVLRDQTNPENSIPQWHRTISERGASYFQLGLNMVGLYDPTDSGSLDSYIVFFQLRARKRGDVTWKNVAQIPYRSQTATPLKKEINIFFQSDRILNKLSDIQRVNGFLEPGEPSNLTNTHSQTASGNLSFELDVTPNIYTTNEGVDVYLNDSYFYESDTEYEFELKRSEMLPEATFTGVITLIYDGDSIDPFDVEQSSGEWITRTRIDNFQDGITIEYSSSVFKDLPIPFNAEVSTLQVRVKNTDISDLSVEAKGLVPTEASGYTTYGESSNPADIFRYLMTGPLSVDQVDVSELDTTEIAAWRAECVTQGYEANGVLRTTIDDALTSVCSAGHARYDEGLLYGVIYDRDTSAEPAVQHFTPYNTSGLSWNKAFSRQPAAFRVEFMDKTRDHQPNELTVTNPFALGNQPEDVEVVSYPLIDSDTNVEKRALLDFQQLTNSLRYSFEVGIESLAVRRGDIALLSATYLSVATRWARVAEVVDGTTLRLTESANDVMSVSLEEGDDLIYISKTCAFVLDVNNYHVAIRPDGTRTTMTRSDFGGAFEPSAVVNYDVVAIETDSSTGGFTLLFEANVPTSIEWATWDMDAAGEYQPPANFNFTEEESRVIEARFNIDGIDSVTGIQPNFFESPDVFVIDDIFSYGVPKSISIRLTSSSDTAIKTILSYDDAHNSITVDSTTGISVGDLCTIGPANQSTQRVIVTSVVPSSTSRATITCMKEVN